MNWILLDEQLNYVSSNSNAQQLTQSGTKQALSSGMQTINKSGYLYVWVSNESAMDVYFDDISVVHYKGALLSEEGYYPFGLVMNARSSHAGAVTPNVYKYNSGTELTEDLDVDYYETYQRQYDAQIGRFTGVDALSQNTLALSPYHFGANNPTLFNDPLGEKDEQSQPDYSDYWDVVLNDLWDESGEFGGSWTNTGGSTGGGWTGYSYSSSQQAVYENLPSAVQYWNNQGWNTAGMLGYLSDKGYINTSSGTNSKGNQGIYVSPAYTTQTHMESDGTEWESGHYYTGFFVKTENHDGNDNGESNWLTAGTTTGALGLSYDLITHSTEALG